MPAAVRMAVWNTWHGVEKGTGDCFCCGGRVTQQDFECGHVVAAVHGGSNTVDNLRTLCRTCNRSMGDKDMLVFKRTYWGERERERISTART